MPRSTEEAADLQAQFGLGNPCCPGQAKRHRGLDPALIETVPRPWNLAIWVKGVKGPSGSKDHGEVIGANRHRRLPKDRNRASQPSTVDLGKTEGENLVESALGWVLER